MKDRNFKMVGYTGSEIDNSWWGRFVIDVAGIRVAGPKLPALREHDRLRPVGIISKTPKTRKELRAEGRFLSTKDGEECHKLIAEGFPMQSSIGVWFEEVEKVSKDETVEVNGTVFTGEGVVIRKSFVREISMVTLGADSDTSVSNLSKGRANNLTSGDNMKQFLTLNDAIQHYVRKGHSVTDAIKVTKKNEPKLIDEWYAAAVAAADANYDDLFEDEG